MTDLVAAPPAASIEPTGYANYAKTNPNRMTPMAAPHNAWNTDGSPWARISFGANNIGRSIEPLQPSTKDLLEARMPVAAAAAVEEELARQSHPAVERRVSIGVNQVTTSAGAAVLQEVSTAFTNRDREAFLQAIQKFTSLDETGGDGAVGAKMTGAGLAKVLGPLIAADPSAARSFLETALPKPAQEAGMSLTAGIKARLVDKVVKDQKRQKQQDMLQDHLVRRRGGDIMPAELYLGPDWKTYTVLQMPSGHDGWEKQGVKTDIIFPGYGFGAHQMVAQFADLEQGPGMHFGETDMHTRGETLDQWAESFVKNSIDS